MQAGFHCGLHVYLTAVESNGKAVRRHQILPNIALIFLRVYLDQNSIAFGSAPRREVDSQPISP